MSEFDQTVLRTLLDLADAESAHDEAAALLERFAHRAVALLPAESCAVAAANEAGELRLLRYSDEGARTLAHLQIAHCSGPIVDCFYSGLPAQCPDVAAASAWPELAEAARAIGIRAFTAVPLRRHGKVLGAACLMYAEPDAHQPETQVLVQAMADSAAVGLLRAGAARRDGRVVEQWQGALNQQITIDQACGILSERCGITVDAAARVLNRDAGAQGIAAAEFARRIVRSMARRPAAGG